MKLKQTLKMRKIDMPPKDIASVEWSPLPFRRTGELRSIGELPLSADHWIMATRSTHSTKSPLILTTSFGHPLYRNTHSLTNGFQRYESSESINALLGIDV